MMKKSNLYLVSTPIGNLADMTPRGVETLKMADRVLCEDTRHSAKLLNHFAIQVPLVPLHEHNESQKIKTILSWLAAGETLALISDAGTPAISDPGMPLVRAVRQAGFEVIPVPGACALIAALSASGLPTDRFSFIGFLPAKAKARSDSLEELQDHNMTLVFYESKHRIQATLESMVAVFGEERQVFLAREITKVFESYFRGSTLEALSWLKAKSDHQKGEFVIVVQAAGKAPIAPQQADQLLALFLDDLPPKPLAAKVSEITGESKKILYQRILELKKHTKA